MNAHLHDWLLPTFAALSLLVATPDAKAKDDARRVVGYGQIRYEGAGPERWALRARRWRRAYLGARRELLATRRSVRYRSTVGEAIDLACATYGNCSTLWRKARCESGLSAFARNAYSGAGGLFQFLPSTWRSTPYGGFSIFSPLANALAAGWMHTHGRGGEWVCR